MRVKTVPASVSGAPAYSVRYGYDVQGLLTYARFSSDTGPGITNTYDGFGRLRLSSTNLGGVTRNVTSDYDAHGNRTRITHPDGAYFEYVYDDADHLFHISENGPSTTLASIFYEKGRRSEIARNTTGSTTGYEYDDILRPELLTHDLDGAGTGNDVAMGFTYNPASQIATRTLSNNAYESPYMNPIRTYAVNGLNQYTQVGGVTFDWDDNGNLTSDGATTFVYDTENRLTSASGAKNASLSYDPLGRLYEVSTSSGVTRFVYDGDSLIAEYSGSGVVLRRYAHGDGVDEPLVWYEGASVSATNRRYLHADYQGSIIAATNASGATLQRNTYDPYGVTATSNTWRFQYTGQAAIPELGLLYYKARFYNPSLGRFMQTDPIGYEDDVNLYAYVRNDPVNKADPTGTTCNTGSHTEGATARTPLPKIESGPGEAAARAAEAFLNDPDISDETKEKVGLGAGAIVVTTATLGVAPEVAVARTALKQGSSALGRKLFGKGALLNRGRNLRIGIGRESGRSTFRVAGEWLGKVPKGLRDQLGIKEIKEGVYKWDWWDRGPL